MNDIPIYEGIMYRKVPLFLICQRCYTAKY